MRIKLFSRKRSSADWQAIFDKVQVLDPDGWDRTNYGQAWQELITEHDADKNLLAAGMFQWPRRIYKPAIARTKFRKRGRA
jgi:hypothetical protein